jgi:hypothetical protein
MKRFVIAIGILYGLATQSGCDAGVSTTAEQPLAIEEQGAGVVAEVVMDDGAEVQFIEPAAGELIITSSYRSDGNSPLQALDIDTLEATEIYEALTGMKAPATLQAAQDRMALMASETPLDAPAVDTEWVVTEPEPASSEAILKWSAREFEDRYCRNVTYCWLNVTGYGRIERRTRHVEGHINAVRGQVRLAISRKRAGGWRRVLSRDVLEGQTVWFRYRRSGIKRRVKVEIQQAVGDRYHFAAGW